MLVAPPPPPPKPNAVICAELDTIPLGNCTELLIVPDGTEVKYELVAAFSAFILVCAEPVKLFSGTMLVEPPPPAEPVQPVAETPDGDWSAGQWTSLDAFGKGKGKNKGGKGAPLEYVVNAEEKATTHGAARRRTLETPANARDATARGTLLQCVRPLTRS